MEGAESAPPWTERRQKSLDWIGLITGHSGFVLKDAFVCSPALLHLGKFVVVRTLQFLTVFLPVLIKIYCEFDKLLGKYKFSKWFED